MESNGVSQGIMDAPVEVHKIQKAYDIISKIYFLLAPFEERARMRGVASAQIEQSDKVLEVAVGTGLSFVEILKRVSREKIVHGIDLSKAMLEKTRKRAIKHGYANFDLKQADARNIPFLDNSFDVLYNSYMLDLIPIKDISKVLDEYLRVLKPGGRIVLVSLSKQGREPILYEMLYKLNPYLLGGCRPVLMENFLREAGFSNVQREVSRLPLITWFVSEVVSGTKRH